MAAFVHVRSYFAAVTACVAAVLPIAPAAPTPQDIRPMSINEDMRIHSDESSAERSLTNVTGLVELSDGKVVTAHASERLLRVFDSGGRFIRTMGRQGDGPGEFRTISLIGAWKDSVWVHDVGNARVTIFPTTGADPRSITLPAGLRVRQGDVVGIFGDDRILLRKTFYTSMQGQASYIMQDPPYAGVVTLNRVHDSTQFSVAHASGSEPRHVFTWIHNRPGRYLSATMNNEPFRMFPELFQPMVTAVTANVPASAKLLIDAPLWNGRPGELRVITVGSDFRIDTSRVTLPARTLARAFADSQVKRIAQGFARRYFRGENVNTTQANAFEAEVRSKIFVPSHFQVVSTTVAGADGSLWINDRFDRRNWLVVSGGGALSSLRLPPDVQLLHATMRRVWGVTATSDGVPILVRYSVR